MSYLFTSESVSEGHPDKVADQISDALIDAFLAQGVQNGTIADASDVTQDANGEYSFNYTKLKQVDVPYLQNKEIFQNKYGFDPYIEADKWNKSRNSGASSSSPVNANTYQ